MRSSESEIGKIKEIEKMKEMKKIEKKIKRQVW